MEFTKQEKEWIEKVKYNNEIYVIDINKDGVTIKQRNDGNLLTVFKFEGENTDIVLKLFTYINCIKAKDTKIDEHNTKYDARIIADYIVNKCYKDNCKITNLHLQNILYILQYRYMQKYETVLFENNFYAYRFGPCIPDIYYKYCGFGSLPLYPPMHFIETEFDKEVKQFIDNVVNEERLIDNMTLSNIVNHKGGAWDLAIQSCEKTIISKKLIYERH